MLKHKIAIGTMLCTLAFTMPALAQEKGKKDVKKSEVSDTTITEEAKDAILDNIPVVSLDDQDNQDGSAQNVSSQLNTGRNPFISAASFNFNVVRFRIRGYDSDLFGTMMNGVPMENLDNGFTPYGQWGGLNDVLRTRQYTPGLQSTKNSFGDLGGSNYIDSRASKQRKQTSIGYSLSNRNYTNRFSITSSTGFNKKGWAFSGSASRRWAEEGFTDGTYYDGWSLYAGVDKKINSRHLLSFVAFATPTENGRQGASVKEMLDIAGSNFYNPYWGYQNGKKRNASIAKTFQPFGILTHEWKISDKASLLTAASYSSGKRSVSGLDWYNAPDPRPDYYRYLPSYYKDEPAIAQQMLEALKNDVNKRQINWDALYNANYGNIATIHNANGITGNDVTGKRSLYIIEERITHTNRFNFNTTLNATLNKHIDFTGGLTYEDQRNNYYKKVDDLLGGDFYVDLNQFAERDFPSNSDANQNDVNNPNRIVKVGDKEGYNYDINIKKASGWAQAYVKLHKIDFFVSAEHSYTQFYRYGNVKSGLFQDNSYGKSKNMDFYNYSVKGGITYKITSGNYFFVNAAYQTKAPFYDNAYLSPRTRDNVQDNLRSEQISSIEGGYVLIAPTVKLRLTGYYTQFKHGTNVLSFYNDDVRNFVNYALSNIGKLHYGVEAGTEVIVYKGLTVNAAAAVGRYRYNTRQNATVTLDNSAQVISNDIIYSNNYNVPTPQEAYNIGINYRSRKYWYVNLNFNYFDQMWLDFNPLRRTYSAVEGVDAGSDKWHEIIDQTKLKPQHTLDLFAGYSWLMNNKFKGMKKRTFLVFSLGVNNILNDKDIVSGGYEQLRFDFVNRDVDKFPSKLFYAYGTNYSASVTLRF